MVPGRKFSRTTSARAMRRRRMACPSGAFMFRVKPFLLRLTDMKYVASPPTKGGQPRVSSPLPGSSILITSAPMSPRNMDPNGPARIRVKSITRTPARGGRAVLLLLAARDALRGARADLRLVLSTGHSFQESFDEALADGRDLLAAIPRAPPEEPRAVGEPHVREVEDRVHVLHRYVRSDLDAASLLAVTEQTRAALELHDGDVQGRSEPLGRRVQRGERDHLADGGHLIRLHGHRMIRTQPRRRRHDAPTARAA